MPDPTPNPFSPSATLHSSRRPLVTAILAGIGLLFATCGASAIYLALDPGAPLVFRSLLFVLGAALLGLPGAFLFALLRRKLTTGRWTLTPEERTQRYREIAARPPSLAAKIISSPWFNRALNLLIVAAAVVDIWSACRNGFRPFDLTIAAIWLGIAALSVWQMSRRRRSIA